MGGVRGARCPSFFPPRAPGWPGAGAGATTIAMPRLPAAGSVTATMNARSALLPAVMLAFANVQNFPFAGTTVLIAVGVALETMKQIDSQLMMRNYEGFLA